MFYDISCEKNVKKIFKTLCQEKIALMLVSTMIFGVKIGLEHDSSKSSLNAKVTAW